VEELWENLCAGIESISTFTPEEMKAAGVEESVSGMPGYVNAGGVLADIDLFDANFFGFSARDAESVDPQQRLFLETAWEALEQAGYDPDAYPGLIGVYGGSDQSTYIYHIYNSGVDPAAYWFGGLMSIGNDKDYLTTQVSYKLNLRGPSLVLQTACSTSLVAVCVACQSLLSYQCDMALAGGVGIQVPQRRGYWYQPGGIFSPDGRCRPFDAAGQGTVFGPGCAIVVLKRLSEALTDGDTIHAVIRGHALNNDGAAKVGYTAPSVNGQVQVIAMAQAMAGVSPDTITLMEAHGTATALGDPIEVAALSQAFRAGTDRRQFCALGSLKGNIGHLSSAAGVAGLIKAVLALRHKKIPPSLHFERPNPQIDFANSPFYVPTQLQEWEANGVPRRAGVSSFGVGGTNAHVVLEEAPPTDDERPARIPQLLILSAKTPGALEAATDRLAAYLQGDDVADLADVAYTLQIGRRPFTHRRALVCGRRDGAAALRARDPNVVLNGSPLSADRTVVLLCSGQGSQYPDMGLGLYRSEPTFRQQLDRCAAALTPHLGFDLRGVIYPADADRADTGGRLERTAVTQPALFAVEYALARLWQEWGLTPRAFIGHSIGEYVAACLAGVMSLEDALALVALRGRLMDALPGGSMLAVPLPEERVLEMVGHNGSIAVAAVNAPGMCVLSGPDEAVERFRVEMARQGLGCRRLHTSHAFHSAMMEPILGEFERAVSRVELRPPQVAYLSNVTGNWIKPEEATSPDYWARHIRQTVRFADGVAQIAAYPDLALVEVGPGRTLCTLVRQQLGAATTHLVVPSLRSHEEEVADDAFLVTAAARLWVGGVRLDWRGFHAHERRRRVPLPTYPFERKRYWVGPLDTPPPAGAAASGAAARDVGGWLYVPSWKPGSAGRRPDLPSRLEWLVFTDAAGLGGQVTDLLKQAGQAVTAVASGELFDRAGDSSYAIRPGAPEDYEALLAGLRAQGRHPQGVLHLWGVTPGEAGRPDPASFATRQDMGFYSLVHLAQALGRHNVAVPMQIGVVTNHLHAVLGDEPIDPSKATVLGPCKGIPQEYSHLRCRNIDVSLADLSGGKLAERLVAELTAETFEAVVAYRKNRRWVQTFEPLPAARPGSEPPRLRPGEAYLITGGLGNIGLTLAEVIAPTPAKLVLVGRSAFPDRAEWDRRAATPDDVGRKVRRLKRLEELGAEVMVCRADAADRGQMERVVGAARERFGPIRGVIHGAANLAADAFAHIHAIDRQAGDGQFRPKAVGLMVLDELLRDNPPDFFFLLSSLSATLGGLGLCAYAAGNHFLDAYAAWGNQADGPAWLSVNWDAWDFVGTGAEAIRPAEGQEAFRRILDGTARQVVVAVGPLSARYDKWVNLQAVEPAKDSAAGTSHARPNLSTPFVAPRNQVEQDVAEVWQQLLGVAPIGIHDKFFELGGHSLLAIQLLSRLREMYRLEIPVQRLFEAPTIAQLAESIERDLQTGRTDEVAKGETEIKEMLDLVESLSDREVQELLGRIGAGAEGGAGHV
jgi:acyl transferase domain-containing protein